MTMAHVDQEAPSHPAGVESPRQHALRASPFLRGAALLFTVVAVACVFQCLSPRFGAWHGGVAATLTGLAPVAAAYRRERRQPVAFRIGPDGLTIQDAHGNAQYRRITGCAQWSNLLLALTLSDEAGRTSPLLVAADAAKPHAFRELAVRGRRCAQEHL
jgi:hypothetical protein